MKRLIVIIAFASLSTACATTGMGLQAAYGAAAVNGHPIPYYPPPPYSGELYNVAVTLLAQNTYQDRTSGRLIYTRNCTEVVTGAPCVLRLNGSSDSTITFNDSRQTCDVVGLK